MEILRWKLAIGYSVSWGESEKVRFEQRLKGGEGLHLLLSGELCFWLRNMWWSGKARARGLALSAASFEYSL